MNNFSYIFKNVWRKLIKVERFFSCYGAHFLISISQVLSAFDIWATYFFVTHFFWQHNDTFVPFYGSNKSQTYSSVSRSRLNDGVSWLQNSRPFRIFHHPFGNSVLDTSSSVEKLTLCPKFTFDVFQFFDVM